jgi:hypothetical protein
MMEALAAALILGGINALGDYLTIALELQTRPAYAVLRICVIGYWIGGIVGMRAKQILLGTVCGAVIGLFVGVAYQLLAPVSPWLALAVAAPLFWIGLALLDTLLHGDVAPIGAIVRGLLAAAISGALFFVLNANWPERTPKDPNIFRLMAIWSGAFFPGFVLLFFNKL